MTIWQRTTQPITPAVTLDEQVHDLGDGWQVTGVAVSAREVISGTPLVLSVRLKAGEPAGNRELRVQPIHILRGEGLPVLSRLIATGAFTPGEEAWYDFPIVPPDDSLEGAYDISMQWAESDKQVLAGRIKVPLGTPQNTYAQLAPLSDGVAVELLSQPITGCIGATTPITIYWHGADGLSADYSAFVHLRDATNTTVAQHDGQPHNGSYPTSVWSPNEVIPDVHPIEAPASVTPGTYDVVVGLYNSAEGNTRLPVGASQTRTIDGAVVIGKIILETCK
jgi:hypothetical protein